ncbi:MAG: hypothetical protein AAGI37_06910 [Planctomycetota bacterium]
MNPAPGYFLKVIIMALAVSIGFTPESQALMRRWEAVEEQLGKELGTAFDQFITEVESSIKANELSGEDVNVRSGNLRQAVQGVVDGPLAGFVGTTEGTTTPYAPTILGSGTTTITPVKAKKLWVPVADNLNPSGLARYTPRALYDAFGEDRIKIFKSRKGNTVVFVENKRNEDGSKQRFKRATKAGRQKGDLKGQLMFVLKDRVVIEGTDALAKGAQRMLPRGEQLMNAAIGRAFPGGLA